MRRLFKTISEFRLEGFAYYQFQTFLGILITYLFFYLCRYNLTPTLESLHGKFGISGNALEMLPSAFMLVYIAGQFVNGFLADRYDPKVMIIVGGLGSAACNAAFGMCGTYWWFLFFWMMNAYCSSMGWSASCRILFHWYPLELWGHVLGVFVAILFLGPPMAEGLSGFNVSAWGWQSAFFIPAFILFLTTCIFTTVSDNQPHDKGFAPEWDIPRAEIPNSSLRFHHYIMQFTDGKLSLACLASVGANFVRWGLVVKLVDLLETPLDQGGMGLSPMMSSTIAMTIFWVGIVLALLIGIVSDRYSKGVRWPSVAVAFFVSSLALSTIVLSEWLLRVPAGPTHAFIAIVLASGLIQSIQVPMFAMAGAIVPKRMRGTGIGIMDGWNQIGIMMAFVVLGKIFNEFGVFGAMVIMTIITFLCGIMVIPLGV